MAPSQVMRRRQLFITHEMTESDYARSVDEIQDGLRPLLKARGFKARGRTFNRLTEDGLTQVINVQMGSSDPPGTTYHPGLRENLHGLFEIRNISPPRIVMAIILAARGEREKAHALLAIQVLETRNPQHPDYVRRLAREPGLGPPNQRLHRTAAESW